jgi:hypothetical protein
MQSSFRKCINKILMFDSLVSCFTRTVVRAFKGWCYLHPDSRVYPLRCVTPWRRLSGGIDRVSSVIVPVAHRQAPKVGFATRLRLVPELELRGRGGVLWLQHPVHTRLICSCRFKIQFDKQWSSVCTTKYW